MDPATFTMIAIVVTAISEILPFTPLKGNGIADAVIQVLLKVFSKEEGSEK